jgi:invasion protein IalB
MRIVLSLLLFLFISACASTQEIKSSEQADAAPSENEAIIKLNVPGGTWSDFRTEFEGNEKQRIRMSMSQRNFGGKWAPVQVICIGSKSPSEEICINANALTNKNEAQLDLKMTISRETENKLSEVIPIPGDFPWGNEISVDISFGESEVEFSLNGKIKIKHHINFQPEVIKVGCSSVKCSFIL